RRYGELQLLIRDRDLLARWDDDHWRSVRIDKCKPVKFESLVGGDRVWAGDRAADGVEESVVDRAARGRPGARQRERAVQGDPPVVGHIVGLGRAERRGGVRIRAAKDQPEKFSRFVARNRADGVKTRLVQTGDRRPLICLE